MFFIKLGIQMHAILCTLPFSIIDFSSSLKESYKECRSTAELIYWRFHPDPWNYNI